MVRGKPLWPRRLELLLAQLACVVARAAGNRVQIDDFDLFAHRAEAPALGAESGGEALSAIAGGVGVRVLGRKRKKKEAADGVKPG